MAVGAYAVRLLYVVMVCAKSFIRRAPYSILRVRAADHPLARPRSPKGQRMTRDHSLDASDMRTNGSPATRGPLGRQRLGIWADGLGHRDRREVFARVRAHESGLSRARRRARWRPAERTSSAIC